MAVVVPLWCEASSVPQSEETSACIVHMLDTCAAGERGGGRGGALCQGEGFAMMGAP